MAKFKVLLEPGEDGWWVVSVPSLPGCLSQGRTRQEALENIREAIELFLESMEPRASPAGTSRTTASEAWVEV